MTRVLFYGADGRQSGEETYPTLLEAQRAARRYVSRDGANRYRTQHQAGQTRYYWYYGEREAFVREAGE